MVGKDISVGRYVAHALGRSSNFSFYDGSSGIAKVNTILGNLGGKLEVVTINFSVMRGMSLKHMNQYN